MRCANFLSYNPRLQLYLASLFLIDSHEVGCLEQVKSSSLFLPPHSTDFNQISLQAFTMFSLDF